MSLFIFPVSQAMQGIKVEVEVCVMGTVGCFLVRIRGLVTAAMN